MNRHIRSLLSKQVSRKDFLKISGVLLISIFGFGNIVRLLSQKSNTHQKDTTYGETTYGSQT